MEEGSIKINREKHFGLFLSFSIPFLKSSFSFPRIFSAVLFAFSKSFLENEVQLLSQDVPSTAASLGFHIVCSMTTEAKEDK